VVRDWWFWGVIVIAAVLEGVFRADMVWREFAVPMVLLLSVAILFRRTHPFPAFAITFGTIIVADVFARVVHGGPTEVYASVFVLVLVYALFRWGSGRHMLAGITILLIISLQNAILAWEGIGAVVGGLIVIFIPAFVGVIVRFVVRNHRHQLTQAKSEEREQLARELHDTVAHHVSAIAIQAQAGRFLASTGSLDGAVDALAVIEEEASRTLTEMRLMVGILRHEETRPEMAPQPGLADIADFARLTEVGAAGAATGGVAVPVITVSLTGDLDNVRPTLAAGVHRMAEEAVTNALKHARDATSIRVEIEGDADRIHLSVTDNGSGRPSVGSAPGYGLVGMQERASLLGGTLTAGPGAGTGWRVAATLPRSGAAIGTARS